MRKTLHIGAADKVAPEIASRKGANPKNQMLRTKLGACRCIIRERFRSDPGHKGTRSRGHKCTARAQVHGKGTGKARQGHKGTRTHDKDTRARRRESTRARGHIDIDVDMDKDIDINMGISKSTHNYKNIYRSKLI